MAARVKLREVVEAIDLPNQDWQSYLNTDTGEIVTVTDEGRIDAVADVSFAIRAGRTCMRLRSARATWSPPRRSFDELRL